MYLPGCSRIYSRQLRVVRNIGDEHFDLKERNNNKDSQLGWVGALNIPSFHGFHFQVSFPNFPCPSQNTGMNTRIVRKNSCELKAELLITELNLLPQNHSQCGQFQSDQSTPPLQTSCSHLIICKARDHSNNRAGSELC